MIADLGNRNVFVNFTRSDRATLEKQQRLQEVLRGISQLFKRLHVCWRTAAEGTAGMDVAELEALVPYKEHSPLGDRDLRGELEKKRGNTVGVVHVCGC